jgi:hypothetical protein
LNDVTHSETLFFSFLFDASENKTNNFTRLQIYFKEKKLWGLVIEIGPVFFPHLNMQKNCWLWAPTILKTIYCRKLCYVSKPRVEQTYFIQMRKHFCRYFLYGLSKQVPFQWCLTYILTIFTISLILVERFLWSLS